VDTIHNGKSYEWNFGDGSLTVITAVPNTSHVFNAIGTYLVRLVAVDSTTCNIRDTAFVHIRVGDIQATIDFKPVKLSPCDSFKYRFDNLSTAPVPFNNTSFTWDFGDGSPQVIQALPAYFTVMQDQELTT
jgi:PKD repeat protein